MHVSQQISSGYRIGGGGTEKTCFGLDHDNSVWGGPVTTTSRKHWDGVGPPQTTGEDYDRVWGDRCLRGTEGSGMVRVFSVQQEKERRRGRRGITNREQVALRGNPLPPPNHCDRGTDSNRKKKDIIYYELRTKLFSTH